MALAAAVAMSPCEGTAAAGAGAATSAASASASMAFILVGGNGSADNAWASRITRSIAAPGLGVESFDAERRTAACRRFNAVGVLIRLF